MKLSIAMLKSFGIGLLFFLPFVIATQQAQAAARDAFAPISAASYDAAVGTAIADSVVGSVDPGDYMQYSSVDFGPGGVASVTIMAAAPDSSAGEVIEVRLDRLNGPAIGSVVIHPTGNYGNSGPMYASVANVVGIHDLFLVPLGARAGVANLYSFVFSRSPVPPTQTTTSYRIGQHFHRAQNPINHEYQVARTHDNVATTGGKMTWWLGDDTYDFSGLDAFRNQHRANNASMLLTFYGSPQWASARPDEVNIHYPNWKGGLAEPRDLNSFGRMVKATVNRYQSDLYAVECWNEPFKNNYNGYDPQHSEFFSGTPTALADMCKVLYLNTKAVDPRIPVICPAEAYDSPIVVNSKTSQGESILKYCDMVGWHPYGYTGIPGVGGDLRAMIGKINGYIRNSGGPMRPIIVTEWGVAYYNNVQSVFQAMSSSQKANVLYQTLKAGMDAGLRGFMVYAYDDGLVGINGTDAVVSAGITNAVRDANKGSLGGP